MQTLKNSANLSENQGPPKSVNFTKSFYIPHYLLKSKSKAENNEIWSRNATSLMKKNIFGNFVRKTGPSPPKTVNFTKPFQLPHYLLKSKSKAEIFKI